tara:strand:- start:1760 stop:1957 length:198 start_codon:yes stop_codon:yes gene_type:complete
MDTRFADYQSILYSSHSLLTLCICKIYSLNPRIKHSNNIEKRLRTAIQEIDAVLTLIDQDGEKDE